MSWPQGSVTVENKEWVLDDSNMDTFYIQDRGGNSMRVQLFEGKLYNLIYDPVVLKGARKFQMRNDDIFVCAFPRTGTHWIFERISMLLQGSADTIPMFFGKQHLDLSSTEFLDALPAPRVVLTHKCLSDGPDQLPETKCKIIYTLRDPKDVAVSLYNLYCDATFFEYKGEFKDFLYLFLDGKVDCDGLFGHIRDAEKFFDEHPDHPVQMCIYEENQKNPLLAVQNLSDFLGLQRNDDLCQAIAEKCSFAKMVVDKDPYAVKYNGKSSLYRKGIVGDWKNWFTDEMLEDYYRVYEEKMKGSRFYERYARDKN